MSFTTNITVNGDAVLGTDVKGALEIPRGTTLQRPKAPRLNIGMIRWNTTLKVIEFHLGNNEWDNLVTTKQADNKYVSINNAIIKSTLNMNNNVITNVANPIDDKDAVNKRYLEIRLTDGYIDADALGGKLPADYALSATRITGGLGLSGGGDLKANRSIEMLEPDDITMSSINEATMTGHSHKLVLLKADLDSIVGYELKEAEVIAGNGLIGGGKGSVTVELGTPGIVSINALNESTQDSHTHTLVLSKEDIAAILNFNPANDESEVIAGGGLTGGGKIKESPIIAMKSPKTITLETTNSIDSDGHTHEFDLDPALLQGIVFPPIEDPFTTGYPIGTTIVASVTPAFGSNADRNVSPTALYPMSKSGITFYAHPNTSETGNVPGKWQWRGSFPTYAGFVNSGPTAGQAVYNYYSLYQRVQ